MNQPVTPPASIAKPSSGLGKFFGGFKSGAMSGALMMGILAAVSFSSGLILAAPLIGMLPPTMMFGTVLTTGLFSGTMSVIRGGGHQAAVAPQAQHTPRSVRAPAQGISQERAQEHAVSESVAPAQATTKWADKVGQRNTNVQQILDRDMTDKSRASAILTERENATNNGMSV